MNALAALLTEKDNATPCIVRISAALGVLVFLGLAILNAARFSPAEFGGGFGAVLAAAGAALRLKASTENTP
jgi:hypothetical protein